MKTIRKLLEEELEKYKKIKARLESKEKKSKGLSLEVIQKGDRAYFYIRENRKGLTKRTYIKVKDYKIARSLAQRTYNSKVESHSKKVIKNLESLLRVYSDFAVDDFYNNLANARKKLVDPVIPTREHIIRIWKSKKIDPSNYHKESLRLTTRIGEMVRSKSEKILSDIFLEIGIEYRYEKPLRLRSGKTIIPDFTFLHPLTNKEIYWEHFGMIDEREYSERFVEKINDYAESGIFVGDRLIVSFETSAQSPDFNRLRDMAKILLDLEEY